LSENLKKQGETETWKNKMEGTEFGENKAKTFNRFYRALLNWIIMANPSSGLFHFLDPVIMPA
jgi:hypothetical protein